MILGVLLLLNFFWAWHAVYSLRRAGHAWRTWFFPPVFALAMAGSLVLFFLARGNDSLPRGFFPTGLVAALYLWHLAVLPGWLLISPGFALFRAVRSWTRARLQPPEGGEPPGMNRRRFLRSLAATAPPAALLGLTGISLPSLNRFRIRRLEIPLSDLPPALDGLTISHVSDTHVGVFTGGPVLREIVRASNQLTPDLVVMTGDLINDDLDDLPEAIDMVRSLESRHGVYLCEGNHDLIPGPWAFAKECKATGLNLLVNEQRSLSIRGERVQILGLRWGLGDPLRSRAEDYSEEAILHSMGQLLRLRDPSAFPILLAHHPHAFDPAAEAGLPLVLAGHTHGGQLMVNENLGFGPAMYRYWSGLYRRGESAVVVSNGAGNWFPLRTAAPAEILHLTLRRKK